MALIKILTIALLLGSCYSWHLVMKIPKAALLKDHAGAYQLWISNSTLNEDQENPLNVLPGLPYKSRDVIDWDEKTIRMVGSIFLIEFLTTEQNFRLYHTIPTFNNPEKVAFRKHFGKRRKCW